MNKEQMRELLKPIIKECLKELIFEEKGVLSHIIKESLQASASSGIVTENKTKTGKSDTRSLVENFHSGLKQGGVFADPSNFMPKKSRQQVPDILKNISVGGMNPFEGTEPLDD